MTDDTPIEEMDLRAFHSTLVDPRMLVTPAFRQLPKDLRWAQLLLVVAAWRDVPACSLPDAPETLAFHAGFGEDVEAWSKVSSLLLAHWIHHGRRLYFPPMFESAKLARDKRETRAHTERDRKRLERARTKLREIGVKLESDALNRAAAQWLEGLAARGINDLKVSPRKVQAWHQVASQLGLFPDDGVEDMGLHQGFRRARPP